MPDTFDDNSEMAEKAIAGQPQQRHSQQSMALGSTDPNFAQWLLETTERLELLEHRLKMERWDHINKQWIPRGKPLLNDEGVNDILSLVAEFYDRNAVLSKLDTSRIMTMMKDLNWGVNNLLFTQWEKYACNPEKFDLIVHITCYPIYLALMRSQEGMTLEALTKVIETKEIHSGSNMQQNKSGSIFSGLFGGKKR